MGELAGGGSVAVAVAVGVVATLAVGFIVYGCFYPHTSRYLVISVCRSFVLRILKNYTHCTLYYNVPPSIFSNSYIVQCKTFQLINFSIL